MDEIKYHPIGVVHSPFKEPKGTPIQPTAALGIKATVEIYHEYEEGLQDLESFLSYNHNIPFSFIKTL